MIRRKDIMFFVWIMMCFFSNHNVLSQSINVMKKNNYKFYPLNSKYRDIVYNYDSCFSMDPKLRNISINNMLYYNDTIINAFMQCKENKILYILKMFDIVLDILCFNYVAQKSILLFNILRYREILLNNILKP